MKTLNQAEVSTVCGGTKNTNQNSVHVEVTTHCSDGQKVHVVVDTYQQNLSPTIINENHIYLNS